MAEFEYRYTLHAVNGEKYHIKSTRPISEIIEEKPATGSWFQLKNGDIYALDHIVKVEQKN